MSNGFDFCLSWGHLAFVWIENYRNEIQQRVFFDTSRPLAG